LPSALTGRHRAAGPRLRMALRPAVPRHADRPGGASEPPGGARMRTKAGFAGFAVVVVVVGVVLGLRLEPHDDAPAPALALPTFSVAVPPMATPGSTAPTEREVHRLTRARPTTPPTTPPPPAEASPVLLGTPDLTSYCRRTYGLSVAVLGRDGWQCAGLFRQPRGIDLNAACRSLYGAGARAEMLKADDQRSWRCYRDGR